MRLIFVSQPFRAYFDKKSADDFLDRYVSPTIGLPTLKDIFAELAKPGRDPRQQFEAFRFAEGIEKPGDLKTGMKLPGIVTNVTAFGAVVIRAPW